MEGQVKKEKAKEAIRLSVIDGGGFKSILNSILFNDEDFTAKELDLMKQMYGEDVVEEAHCNLLEIDELIFVYHLIDEKLYNNEKTININEWFAEYEQDSYIDFSSENQELINTNPTLAFDTFKQLVANRAKVFELAGI